MRARKKTTLEDLTSKSEITTSGFKEPKKWTIITALDRVLDLANGSGLDEEFWEMAKSPLKFLRKELDLTDMQIIFVASLVESGEPMSWRKFGNFLGCTRLKIMVYSEEMEALEKKRWIHKNASREMGGLYEGYSLTRGVVTALRHNTTFIPEKIDGMNTQALVDRLEQYLDRSRNNFMANFADEEQWMLRLVEANSQLPLCKAVLAYNNIHIQSLLLYIVFDYAQWANSPDEGVTQSTLDNLYTDDFETSQMKRMLKKGDHTLMKDGWIEHKCEDGIANPERYALTPKAKRELLSDYVPSGSQVVNESENYQGFKSWESIKEKRLFFNAAEQKQIDRLTDLLSKESLPLVQNRLEKQGMRKGFACLFYGAPGTGKTESVLQIARKTGRDIIQVDIASIRNKYVGESEKNIKEVFTKYRALCKQSEMMPILFFNEADAVINRRNEKIEHSVDKMDNAIQNIILQEIENLDGILIATTNLTSNLDKAFERRFIFKIEFKQPEVDVKTQIWTSMMENISSKDAQYLASKYDFSGGQIENIARKRTIDYILTGKESSLEELESYCEVELLDNAKSKQHFTVGF